jgi:hypothetical protein
MRRSTEQSFPTQLVFPAIGIDPNYGIRRFEGKKGKNHFFSLLPMPGNNKLEYLSKVLFSG